LLRLTVASTSYGAADKILRRLTAYEVYGGGYGLYFLLVYLERVEVMGEVCSMTRDLMTLTKLKDDSRFMTPVI